jgi:hypothetical protein
MSQEGDGRLVKRSKRGIIGKELQQRSLRDLGEARDALYRLMSVVNPFGPEYIDFHAAMQAIDIVAVASVRMAFLHKDTGPHPRAVPDSTAP